MSGIVKSLLDVWSTETALSAAAKGLADIPHGCELKTLGVRHDVIDLLLEADAIGDVKFWRMTVPRTPFHGSGAGARSVTIFLTESATSGAARDSGVIRRVEDGVRIELTNYSFAGCSLTD